VLLRGLRRAAGLDAGLVANGSRAVAQHAIYIDDALRIHVDG